MFFFLTKSADCLSKTKTAIRLLFFFFEGEHNVAG